MTVRPEDADELFGQQLRSQRFHLGHVSQQPQHVSVQFLFVRKLLRVSRHQTDDVRADENGSRDAKGRPGCVWNTAYTFEPVSGWVQTAAFTLTDQTCRVNPAARTLAFQTRRRSSAPSDTPGRGSCRYTPGTSGSYPASRR